MTVRSFGGRQPQVSPSAWIDESAVVIGDVRIGEQSSVWPMVVARGDINAISIGDHTNIQDGAILHVTHDSAEMGAGCPLSIGSHVTVGHRAILHGCTIGDWCLVGMGATVMDGAALAPYTVIAAGALVSPGKHLEGGYLWMGSPARRARPLSDEERAFIGYSAEHYARLKEQHRALKPP
jgi:carbonic anhydrase/acetyltransferase-like protein (isoleucine patch superfamily)